MRTKKTNDNIVALTAATLAKQAEVTYLKGRVYVQEHPEEVKACGLGALVGAALATIISVA